MAVFMWGRGLSVALALLLVQSGASAGCPETCACSTDGLFAACLGLLSESLPEGLNASLQELDLSGHSMFSLDDDTFLSVPNLESVDLSDGRLKQVTVEAFASLPQLRHVDLSSNELTYLPMEAFNTNEYLESLQLADNPLVMPPEGYFFLMSAHLTSLDLSSCSLTSLPTSAFALLPSLAEVNLRGNNLHNLSSRDVEALINLKSVFVDPDTFSTEALQMLRGVNVSVELPIDVEASQPFFYTSFLDGRNAYQPSGPLFEDDDLGTYPVGGGVFDEEVDNVPSDTVIARIELDITAGMAQPPPPPHHRRWGLEWTDILVGSLVFCMGGALLYMAVSLLCARSRSGPAASDTLARAYLRIAPERIAPTLPPQDKNGYRRLQEEEDVGQLQQCTCLSCSETVPRYPCIRNYQQPLPQGVHVAVGIPPAYTA